MPLVDVGLQVCIATTRTHRKERRYGIIAQPRAKSCPTPPNCVLFSSYLLPSMCSVRKYEFVRGNVSSFPYFDYYESLHAVRGAEVRSERAVAFDFARSGKKRILDALP